MLPDRQLFGRAVVPWVSFRRFPQLLLLGMNSRFGIKGVKNSKGLLELTGNIALVQEALGHQDPKTTQGFTRVKVAQIIDGVRALGKQERGD